MVSKLIKVLVVDESEPIRRALKQTISQDSRIHLVATARDAFEAKEMVKELKPDVIILDVDMFNVDSLRFLEELMMAQPTPVVMVSSLADAKGEFTLKARELGAVDYIEKPSNYELSQLECYANSVVHRVKQAYDEL